MREYVDSCLTFQILLQDSGLAPKPNEDWNVFVPQQGDVAHVDEDDSDYEFDGTEWKKLEDPKNEDF